MICNTPNPLPSKAAAVSNLPGFKLPANSTGRKGIMAGLLSNCSRKSGVILRQLLPHQRSLTTTPLRYATRMPVSAVARPSTPKIKTSSKVTLLDCSIFRECQRTPKLPAFWQGTSNANTEAHKFLSTVSKWLAGAINCLQSLPNGPRSQKNVGRSTTQGNQQKNISTLERAQRRREGEVGSLDSTYVCHCIQKCQMTLLSTIPSVSSASILTAYIYSQIQGQGHDLGNVWIAQGSKARHHQEEWAKNPIWIQQIHIPRVCKKEGAVTR